jgi:Phage P22-like portal protein
VITDESVDIHGRPATGDADEELLNEIRDRYKAYDTEWEKIREERDIDLRYICGDPWDPKDRKARTDAGRPCINHDELSQYVNSTVNNVRQNKRGIKVDPQGQGSNDQSAALRQDLIRTIEYDCNAASIYAASYQDMVEGSYSFFRIGRRYVSDDIESDDPGLFDQEIVIKPISNPNSVLYDPRCKEPDWSDAKACFVLERVPKQEFKLRWPHARMTDFSWVNYDYAADWLFDQDVLVAEYWRVETTRVKRYLLEDGTVVFHPRGRPVDKWRWVEQRCVKQYITNGVEILEKPEDPEPGTIIPIIPMIGMQRFRDSGGFSRRELFSLVRLARDPQLSLAYLNSQEMEEAGLTPKSPFLGYKGQFDSSRTMWSNVTKIPYAFLEADIPDNWPVGQVPPLPQRVPFTPNFQSYEVAKDSCRRAIQAAMGITPMPTAMQRASEKSGVALERIENMEALGSFHFVDGYDRAIRLAGRVIDQWIPAVYTRQRTKHVRKPDDSYRRIELNTEAPYADHKTGAPVHFPVDDVDHSISISSGPSVNSQRDAVSKFLDGLIGQLPQLPISPPQAAKLLALAIQMKNLGPKGDEMAEIISPTEGSPDQSQQQLAMAQGQLQQQGILIQQLQAELQKLTVERQAKVVEGEYKLLTERMRTEANLLIERLKVDAQIATAEVQTKSQIINERIAAIDELNKQSRDQTHEATLQEQQQQHEVRLAQQEYLQQSMEAQQGRDHELNLAQQQQEQQPEQPEEKP